jgi:5-methylcytosine-specific restriction endonuclease McrA
MVFCLICSTETCNPKFCSRRCAAIFNNTANPKRKKSTYHCVTCGSLAKYRRKYCELHSPGKIDWDSVRIADMKSSHRYSKHMYIRELARKKYFNSPSTAKACAKCGYDVHIEVCHIKAISNFPATSLLKEVNDLSNLVGLCRNHHWELDHGILSINDLV